MLRKLLLSVLIVLLMQHSFTLSGSARNQNQDPSAEGKEKIGEVFGFCEKRVVLKLRDGRKLKGYINAWDNCCGFIFTNVGKSDSDTISSGIIPYAEVQEVKCEGISKGKKVLIAAGVAIGVVLVIIGAKK